MKTGFKKYLIASFVLAGGCIGAGVLGIPYVASQAGFFITLLYILIIGGLILLVNLYLGEIELRTKGDHQLIGYVERYLGKVPRHVMEFAFVFGMYAALIAYMSGIGQSISYLIFGSMKYYLLFGILFGSFMSFLLYKGLSSLKKFEKWGVLIVLGLLTFIFVFFIGKVDYSNFLGHNFHYLFLPFGVVLFAFMIFQSMPQVKLVLKNNEKYLKKAIITGTLISMGFYILFTFVVLGYMGHNTPSVATIGLGKIFVFLGIFTMFTSYLANGNAMVESFQFDERYSFKGSWLLASILPIVLFILTQLSDFFSFTKLLSIGGVVSAGIMAMVILFMVQNAKKRSNREPEYKIPSNWIFIIVLVAVFLFAMVSQLVH